MRILFFAISFLAMPLGAAQAQNYIGISGGLMTYEANDTEIDSQGFTIVAGGQFDPILAVEFSYSAHSSVEVAGADYKASVMALSGVLRSPGEGFEPFLRLGIARGDSILQAAQMMVRKTALFSALVPISA
jgi:hypothetical protein